MRYLIFILLFALSACSNQQNQQKKDLEQMMRLHNLWSLVSIYEAPPKEDEPLEKQPFMELHLENEEAMGNGPCNNFNAKLIVEAPNIIRLDGIVTTRMACVNLRLENDFFQALEQIHSFKLKGLHLHLFDKEGKELLVFKKVD